MYYKQIDNEQVEKLLLEKDYNQILRIFFDSLNMSVVQFAARMKCSRRAMGRYLSGERQVPMAIIKQIMSKCNITFSEKETDDEFDKEGYFRWYSELDNLFNTLFLYRTKELGISRFQMACDLNVSCNVLLEYEHGIKRIIPSDVDKILGTYDLRIEELFPMLVTFDGRSTFLPLKPLSCVIFNGTEYDLWESVYSEDDLCNIWPTFPMQRYDSRCQLLMKYMPEELSLDEYVNATDMVFDLDNGYYSRDLTNVKLPPSYEHLQRCTSKVFRSDRPCEHFNVHVSEIQFIDDYCVQILSDNGAETFSLEDYIFSDSKWYNLLQDKEYFKQGKLVMIGEPCCINQCIIWPGKQFVRIIELYKDKYPQNLYEIEYAEVSNKIYERWVDYRSSSGIRYSDYDEKDYYYYQCKTDRAKYKHSISVNGKLWQFDSVKELAQKLDKAPSTIYYYLKRGLNYKDIIEKVTMSFKAVTVAGIDYVFCSDSDLSTRLGKSSSYVNVYRRAGLSYEEIIVKALHLKG